MSEVGKQLSLELFISKLVVSFETVVHSGCVHIASLRLSIANAKMCLPGQALPTSTERAAVGRFIPDHPPTSPADKKGLLPQI